VSRSNIKYGGEFEINPKLLERFDFNELKNNKTSYFASGRHALKYILQEIKQQTNKNTIYLPEFICTTVINTCIEQKWYIEYYPLKNNLTVDLTISNFTKDSVVLFVNYFGLMDHNSFIEKLKQNRKDLLIVSDTTQAFWESSKTKGDYVFNSFRKLLPVPQGAQIFQESTPIEIKESFQESQYDTYKIIGGLLKWMNIKDQAYLNFFEKGETQLDSEKSILFANKLSAFLFENLNLKELKDKRKRNAEFVFDKCKKEKINVLLDYQSERVPLVVPILTNNRNKIREELYEDNIFLPLHWPNITNLDSNNNIYKNILSIIIDHRYNRSEIDYMLKIIFSKIKKYEKR